MKSLLDVKVTQLENGQIATSVDGQVDPTTAIGLLERAIFKLLSEGQKIHPSAGGIPVTTDLPPLIPKRF